MNEKVFRPSCAPFIIGMGILNLMGAGSAYVVIYSILQQDLLGLAAGIGMLGFVIHTDIKILVWKVAFYEEHLLIPLSHIGEYNYNKNQTRTIYYHDVTKLVLMIRPMQILGIHCASEDEPHLINVKAFSKKQVYGIMDEIDLRIMNLGLPKADRKIIE